MSRPDNSIIGLCPKCGAVPAEDWIKGSHGWVCGTFFRHHRFSENPTTYRQGDQLTQSIPCAVMHWRVRAEKAEAKLREIALDSPE